MLSKSSFLLRSNQFYPLQFFLTHIGKMYLETHFAEPLKLGSEFADPDRTSNDIENPEKPPKVGLKHRKNDIEISGTLRFRQLLEDYLENLPPGYPKKAIFKIRGHWITYKFPIIQQDQYLTNYGEDEFGLLGKQTWVTVVPMKNWWKYQGWISYLKTKFFVMFTTKSFILRFLMLFGHDPLEVIDRTVNLLFEAKAELETRFSSSRTRFILGDIEHDIISHCISKHYGILLTPLSVLCDQLGIILEDAEGRVRIDASNEVPETETIHRAYSTEDAVFLFQSLPWQIRNEYRIIEAHKDIKNLEGTSIKLNNQYLSLADQVHLEKYRFDTIEHYMTDFSRSLAEAGKVIRDSQISSAVQFDQIDERVNGIELIFDRQAVMQREDLVQGIFYFLKTRPKKEGYTRKEIAKRLKLRLGSVSPTITKLVKDGFLLEIKGPPGRYKLR